jgi:hypothetical protein
VTRRIATAVVAAALLAACASVEAEPATPAPTVPPLTLPPGLQKEVDKAGDRVAWLRRANEACGLRHDARITAAERAFEKLDEQWDQTSEPSAAWDAALAKLKAAQNAKDHCIDNFEGGGPPGVLD